MSSVSKGRVDAVLELEDKVYVIEFKYEKCSPGTGVDEKRKLSAKALDKAIEQINSKGYAEKYQGSGKNIYKVAFVFLGRNDIEMLIFGY